MEKNLKTILAGLLLWQALCANALTLKIGLRYLETTPTENGLNVTIGYGDIVQLSGKFGIGIDFTNLNCGIGTCKVSDDIQFSLDAIDNGFIYIWKTDNINITFMDCFNFDSDVQWYGGPQRSVQVWPLQKMTISREKAYVSRKDDNFGVAERYWLNSKGLYIYLDERNPLFVSQNEENNNDGDLCFISKVDGPYFNRTRNILNYTTILFSDPKEAHLHAINTVIGKPIGHPDYNMIKEPIWTTWANYKRDIDDKIVREFAEEIRSNGYKNGQIEIDDSWEKCRGAQEFSEDKFSNITAVVKQLRDMNFRVTLWIHPFVNDDCQKTLDEGRAKGYFVKSVDGLDNATWWDGDQIGHQIDFTNKEAAEWWSNRVTKLKDVVDSFKFDAGETDYGQQPSVYPNVDQELIPNILTSSYIRTCAKFGNLIEVRSAWRTQDMPFFIRMLDKDTSWGFQNGLRTLVTTLFQLNMNGYTMVLPDMIGGNGYSSLYPTPELLIRWTQTNTFMPAMQFSFLPWEFSSTEFDVPSIIQKFVELHENFSPVILEAMENSTKYGRPVNPPIWWVAPTDPIALANDDEYLVGEKILVAPVMSEGATSRSVYLPEGRWEDGNNGNIYEGPLTINYEASIDVLPYFFRV